MLYVQESDMARKAEIKLFLIDSLISMLFRKGEKKV